MVFYAAFNNISLMSQRQLFIVQVSPRLWCVLPKDTPTKQKPEDSVRLEPGPLDYNSNTLPLSHEGTQKNGGIA